MKLMDVINFQYSKAGFMGKKISDETSVFQNKFSLHFIFICGRSDHFSDKYFTFHDYFKSEYIKGGLTPDLYWNFYEIYIFEDSDAEGFNEFKEKTEMDFQMSRKYVYLADEIRKLPPLHLSMHTAGRSVTESPWEDEWKESIGEELYNRIMDAQKTKIDDILQEYLDDKLHTN